MIPHAREIWRQAITLPPDQRALVTELFREIEHQNQLLESESKTTLSNCEFQFNTTKSKYYQPKWFGDCSNGKIQ